MTFYGETMLALGILILIVTAAAAAVFGLVCLISSKRIKSRIAAEYGEKPKR